MRHSDSGGLLDDEETRLQKLPLMRWGTRTNITEQREQIPFHWRLAGLYSLIMSVATDSCTDFIAHNAVASAAESGGDGSSASSVLYAKLCDIGSSTPAMKNRLCMWSTMKGGSGDAVVTSVESIPNASWITSPPRSSCQVQAVLDRSRGGSGRKWICLLSDLGDDKFAIA